MGVQDYLVKGQVDGRMLARAIRYTEHNPTKAKLVRDVKDWPWSSARLRDQYNRLPWQTTVRAEGP